MATVSQVMAGEVNNPSLPTGAEYTPVILDSSQQGITNRGEAMTGANTTLNTTNPTNFVQPQTQQVQPQQATTTTAQTSQVDPNQALNQINPTAGQYQATTIGPNAAQGEAAQGAVNPLATVQGQLEQLYAQSTDGKIPVWAQGAARMANDIMAARGLGASTIGATAVQAAIQESAFNIASKDAAIYFGMDLANLNNRQQTAMQNLQNRQQGLLSDQAAMNAASQFNASSEQQVQQFMSQLVAQIQSQNADRSQAISQFNAGEANKIGQFNATNDLTAQTFNAQQRQAIEEFNSTLKHQREVFNATNQLAIEQSNVLWRRTLNSENTAAVNAANQLNTQNKFNLSSTALNNIWQQMRDEASWAFIASENDKTRAANAANSANNRQFVSQQQNSGTNWAAAAGSFAAGLLL